MAFADDLVLTTEERIHMQILLERCKKFSMRMISLQILENVLV